MAFEGYTGGGNKEMIDNLMSSGDVGYFDADGLLYVSGRDDEMIVSGGENVFPAEVEDLISMLEDEEGEKIENLLENPGSLSLSVTSMARVDSTSSTN